MPEWDEAQYLKFADARTRPAAELLARVPLDAPQLLVDLGCGPGNSTALLQARWPSSQIIGVDSSEPMLSVARSELPRVRFVQADVRRFRPAEPADLLFANAVLHWLPDHDGLFPELLTRLTPGGCLAVQMPDNWQEPSHRLMREVAQRYLPDLSAVKVHAPIKSSDAYYDLLAPRARLLDVWQTRYQQVMPDAAAIVEWVKGSGLRPYLEAVASHQQAAFLRDYEHEISQAYPARSDGKRLFAFPRLFIVCLL
jgi:trans-aconitate 2-methyltransferase